MKEDMELEVIREVNSGTNNFKVLKEVKNHKALVRFNDKEYVVYAKNDFDDSFFWGKYYGDNLEGAIEKFESWEV